MAEFVREEKEIKEENLRLQRRLQLEMERREALCRYVLIQITSNCITLHHFVSFAVKWCLEQEQDVTLLYVALNYAT